MPKWGLTDRHRESEPWGLPKDVLKPSKTITDPVHGDIYINEIERMVIDSAPLQRLRRVRQLGSTHLVYPGATHTRFSHTLGALRAAQDLLDAVLEQRYAPNPAKDLFFEWENDKNLDEHDRQKLVAEAIVLTRLGALLHDMCHVPYGHSIEDDIGILDPHDSNIARFETLWGQFDETLKKLISPELKSALKPLILSKDESPEAQEKGPYPFVIDIVGNTICADLLDYLPRDHLFTGLPARLGHRFIDGFYVTDSSHPNYPRQMVMRIGRNGRERADVVSELFKYLRYRYELSERALVHHAKLAADAMIGKLLEMWSDSIWVDLAFKRVPDLHASRVDIDSVRGEVSSKNSDLPKEIDTLVRERLEAEFLRHGDDGLLEYILDYVSSVDIKDTRIIAIESLATRIQTRKLYKLIAQCRNKPQAESIHKKYGNPEARRRLEEGAAKYAGLKHKWHILFWIPSPLMRLKAAEVMVEDAEGHILRLHELDAEGGRHRGFDIYESHKALWSISVFAPGEIKDDKFRMNAALAWTASKLNINWDKTVPDKTIPSLTALVSEYIGAERALTRSAEMKLEKALNDELEVSGRAAVTLNSFDELIKLGLQVLEKLLTAETTDELLALEFVRKVLSGYLPKSLKSGDRKALDEYLPLFVAQANTLSKKQREFIRKKLSSMKPEGGRQLEAAITRLDTIKSVLENILDEARNK